VKKFKLFGTSVDLAKPSFKPILSASKYAALLLFVFFVLRYAGFEISFEKLINTAKNLGSLVWMATAIFGLFVWLLQSSNQLYLTGQKELNNYRFEDLKIFNKDTIQREVKMIITEELEQKLIKIVTDAISPVYTRLDGIDSRLDGIDSRLDRIETCLSTELPAIKNRLDSIEEHLTK
jgi:hypothetical protein